MTNAYDTEAEPPEQRPPEQPPVSENFLEKNGDVPRPDSSPPQQVADLGSTPDPERDRWLARTRAPTPPAAPPTIPPTAFGARPPARPPNFGPPQGQPPPPWPPVFSPNRRQWYFSPPARGPGMWGMPRRFPMLPPLWQIPMLFSQIGMGLGQFGSGMLSPLGFGLNRYTLAFMNGMQKGQLQYSKQMREQMDLQADQADQQLQAELDDYNQAFREYGDPNDVSTIKPQNIPKLKQRLYELARKYNDQHMKNALDNNDIQGAVDQLKYLDQKHGDLKAGRTSRKSEKETKDEKKEAGWGGEEKPASGPAHWPRSEEEERTMMRPPAAAAARPTEAAGKLTEPAEEADARAEYRGAPWSKEGIPPEALARIQHRAGLLRDQEDRALDAAKNPTVDDKLNALDAVDPSVAAGVRAAVNYDVRMPYGREGMPPRIAQLAKRVDPTWDQTTYQYITEFKNPNSKEGQMLQRSTSMAGVGKEVIAAARALVDKYGIEVLDNTSVWNSLQQWKDGKIAGDPEWAALFTAYNGFVEDAVTVARMGTGNEGDILRQFYATPIANIRQILASVSIETGLAVSRIEAGKSHWDTNTQGKHGPAPGYSEDTMKTMRGMRTLDPNDFSFAPSAPEDLRVLAPGQPGSPEMIERRERHEGRVKERAATELRPKIEGARKWLKDNPDADPALRKQAEDKIRELEEGLGGK